MTMSWVAPAKPTSTAKAAIRQRSPAGLDPAISHSPRITTAWVTSIHERRWPISGVRIGTAVRSTSGAQTNFSE
jgi:hypothetical protein